MLADEVGVAPYLIRAAGLVRRAAQGTRLCVAIACAACAAPPAVHANAEADCHAIGQDALRVDLAAKAGATRRVRLRSGEVLQFGFQGRQGPFGVLALVEGPGAPRMLLVGPAGTEASFTAPQSGV